MAERPCRNCPDARLVADEDIRRLLAKLESRAACVPDDVYRRRLAACGDCAALLSGHTCRHCGCFVAVRAKLAERDCPHPESSRWRAAAAPNGSLNESQ